MAQPAAAPTLRPGANRYTVQVSGSLVTVQVNGTEALRFTADQLTAAGPLSFGLEGAAGQTVTLALDNLLVVAGVD